MLDRYRRQFGRWAVAKTTAEAILPLRPATDDTGPDGVQFAQSSHRRRWRRPWRRVEQRSVVADQDSIDLVGLITAKLGSGQVADLRRVDNADDVTRFIQR